MHLQFVRTVGTRTELQAADEMMQLLQALMPDTETTWSAAAKGSTAPLAPAYTKNNESHVFKCLYLTNPIPLLVVLCSTTPHLYPEMQVGHKMLAGLALRTSKGCVMGESPHRAPHRCPAPWKRPRLWRRGGRIVGRDRSQTDGIEGHFIMFRRGMTGRCILCLTRRPCSHFVCVWCRILVVCTHSSPALHDGAACLRAFVEFCWRESAWTVLWSVCQT